MSVGSELSNVGVKKRREFIVWHSLTLGIAICLIFIVETPIPESTPMSSRILFTTLLCGSAYRAYKLFADYVLEQGDWIIGAARHNYVGDVRGGENDVKGVLNAVNKFVRVSVFLMALIWILLPQLQIIEPIGIIAALYSAYISNIVANFNLKSNIANKIVNENISAEMNR